MIFIYLFVFILEHFEYYFGIIFSLVILSGITYLINMFTKNCNLNLKKKYYLLGIILTFKF